jgi:hypothetical protein
VCSASSWLSHPASSHIWSLRTECANVYRRKAQAVDINALAVKPIITGLAIKHKSKLYVQPQTYSAAYHWIMKPSLSVLLQTHLVAPFPELVGVAASGSVTVVGDMLVDEP